MVATKLPAGTSAGRLMPTRAISNAAARRFLVRRHLLAPPRSLPASIDGVRAAFARVGSIQFDPLGVAGRNHDLVLHARVRGYRSAWTDTLLYETRELYETFNKGLSLVPTRELPWFRINWDRAQMDDRVAQQNERRETMEHVLEQIRARGPMSTNEFEGHRTAKAVDWFWGPTNEIRAALEALWEAGILGLDRREGNRRFYDLAERIYPPELLAERPGPREQRRHKLLSRFRAHGLLGNAGQAELWLGTAPGKEDPSDPTRFSRRVLREELLAMGEVEPVQIEGVRGPRYVIREDLAELDRAIAEPDGALADSTHGPDVTFLGALDPLVWDREFLRELFKFDYVWEVYVPAAKRRWGYYVLPLLFGDRLVGRIEPRIDRATRTVRVLGLWWEQGFDPRTAEGFAPAMRAALADYLDFGDATRVEWAPALNRERRLFGTRPRSRAATAQRSAVEAACAGRRPSLLLKQLAQSARRDAEADRAQDQQVRDIDDEQR